MVDNRFAVVGQLRDRISRKQERAIKQLYRGVLSSLYREEQRLKSLGLSESARAMQVQQLRSVAIRLMNQVANRLSGHVQAGVEEITSATLELYGRNVATAQAITMAFMSGNVYGGGWSLSSSIWGNNSKQINDIYNIVARGNLLGYSFEQIADQLKKYVNPDKLYDWDGPGHLRVYSHSVDYNAQRLVRTMMTHAYQYSQWLMTHNDDGLLGYRWHAQGPRACPICRERDQVIFPVDDVPWDHPNGMCYIEPVYSSVGNLSSFVDMATDTFIDRHYSSFSKRIK